MRCPFCSHPDSKVIDSRLSKDGSVTRRRRECESCSRRFTTREYVETATVVVKKDGRREDFDRAKIIAGLRRACEKRPISADILDRLVAEIERELADGGEREIDSKVIGEKVMARLRGLDEVAYVRFASVYRQFRDAREFLTELASLTSGPAGAGREG